MEEEALRLARHGSLKAAADVCRALTARHPQFGPGWRAASSIALQMGDPGGALGFIEHALGLLPSDGRSLLLKAHALLATQRRKEAIETAQRAYGHIKDDAVALDSFTALRRHLKYDISQDVESIEWVIHTFRSDPATVTGSPSRKPIFIVGLPGSGASRVERILGSHSTVFPAGELTDFSQALLAAVTAAAGSKNLGRRDLITGSARIDCAALAAEYLRRAHLVTGATERFVDRMPLNFLYCGLIKRALPNARMVHLTRHPLVLCYSIYKSLFRDDYALSYDLGDIGRYYVAYRRLMSHWHASLPGWIHNLQFERLMADPGGETRRLLEFCGLEPQDACLASAAQVRQSSDDAWRHSAQQLGKLRDQLIAAGIDVAS